MVTFDITPLINYFPEKYSTSVGRVSVSRVVYFEAENSVGLTTEHRATFEDLPLSSGSSARQSIPRYII